MAAVVHVDGVPAAGTSPREEPSTAQRSALPGRNVIVEALDQEQELLVDPGGEAVARFRVRNRGSDVNNFTFRIVGEPNQWKQSDVRVVRGEFEDEEKKPTGSASVKKKPTGSESAKLNLLPNEEGTVVVTFRPPRTWETPAGKVPYGLLVCSRDTDDENKPIERFEVIEEGRLKIAEFPKRKAQLLPRTSRGRFSGKHRFAIDNYGNSPATVDKLWAEDAENQLDADFSPATLVVQPGTREIMKVKLKPRGKFLLGPPRACPFALKVKFVNDTAEGDDVVEGETIPPEDRQGLFMQRSVLPPLLLPIAALVIAGVILWAALKPQAHSTAKQLAPAQAEARATALALKAVNTQHRDAKSALDFAKGAAKRAHKDATLTQKLATVATVDAKHAVGSAALAAKTATKALRIARPFGGTPYGQQLTSSSQPFTTKSYAALYVTDLLLSNSGSAGTGTVKILFGGKPVLRQALSSATNSFDLKPFTPLLLSAGETIEVKCDPTSPCTPSVYVSGLGAKAKPNPSGPNGTPKWTMLCWPKSSCSVMKVPQAARSYELTDVILQNPQNDKGTVTLTLSGHKQPLLVEKLDAFPPSGNLSISFATPIVLKAGATLTLTASCGNCKPGALLNGVLKLR